MRKHWLELLDNLSSCSICSKVSVRCVTKFLRVDQEGYPHALEPQGGVFHTLMSCFG